MLPPLSQLCLTPEPRFISIGSARHSSLMDNGGVKSPCSSVLESSSCFPSPLPRAGFAHCCSCCPSPEQGLLIKAIISLLDSFVSQTGAPWFPLPVIFFPVISKAASICELLFHLPPALTCICVFCFSFAIKTVSNSARIRIPLGDFKCTARKIWT